MRIANALCELQMRVVNSQNANCQPANCLLMYSKAYSHWLLFYIYVRTFICLNLNDINLKIDHILVELYAQDNFSAK